MVPQYLYLSLISIPASDVVGFAVHRIQSNGTRDDESVRLLGPSSSWLDGESQRMMVAMALPLV